MIESVFFFLMMSGRLDEPAPVASGLPSRRGGRVERQANTGLDQRLQRHRHLHARNAGSGAKMRPGAEGQMLVRSAVEAHFIGLLEHGWVAVCRTEAERDDVAGCNRAAVQRDVVRGISPEDLDRRGVAQEFLDRGRDHGRVGCKPRQRLGMFARASCSMTESASAVVSKPAPNTTVMNERIWLSSSRSPSISAAISVLMKSPVGRDAALGDQRRRYRRRARGSPRRRRPGR